LPKGKAGALGDQRMRLRSSKRGYCVTLASLTYGGRPEAAKLPFASTARCWSGQERPGPALQIKGCPSAWTILFVRPAHIFSQLMQCCQREGVIFEIQNGFRVPLIHKVHLVIISDTSAISYSSPFAGRVDNICESSLRQTNK
jgi:hypothetical protein